MEFARSFGIAVRNTATTLFWVDVDPLLWCWFPLYWTIWSHHHVEIPHIFHHFPVLCWFRLVSFVHTSPRWTVSEGCDCTVESKSQLLEYGWKSTVVIQAFTHHYIISHGIKESYCILCVWQRKYVHKSKIRHKIMWTNNFMRLEWTTVRQPHISSAPFLPVPSL